MSNICVGFSGVEAKLLIRLCDFFLAKACEHNPGMHVMDIGKLADITSSGEIGRVVAIRQAIRRYMNCPVGLTMEELEELLNAKKKETD